ncbi:MAG: RNA-binding S4 domain-containing protein [Alkalilacustris sp.]
MTRPEPEAPEAVAIRLDKWLWHARFFKTRSLAAQVAASGKVRINGRRVSKPSAAVGPGDVLTFVAGGQVRVVRVRAPGLRRGPAAEARSLYEDLEQAGESAPGRGGDSGPDTLD